MLDAGVFLVDLSVFGGMSMAGRVELLESEIRVLDISVSNKDSVAFLSRLPDEDRVAIIQKAIEVGLFCLERGQNAGDLEFVRRKIGELLASVESAIGGIPAQTGEALLDKIGSENGQVLAPVRVAVEGVATAIGQKLADVKGLLQNDLDPKMRHQRSARRSRTSALSWTPKTPTQFKSR